MCTSTVTSVLAANLLRIHCTFIAHLLRIYCTFIAQLLLPGGMSTSTRMQQLTQVGTNTRRVVANTSHRGVAHLFVKGNDQCHKRKLHVPGGRVVEHLQPNDHAQLWHRRVCVVCRLTDGVCYFFFFFFCGAALTTHTEKYTNSHRNTQNTPRHTQCVSSTVRRTRTLYATQHLNQN